VYQGKEVARLRDIRTGEDGRGGSKKVKAPPQMSAQVEGGKGGGPHVPPNLNSQSHQWGGWGNIERTNLKL
jgi:hypothetical protein